MDTYRERSDSWRSVLLVAAAIGLTAGLYLVTYQTLYYQLAMTSLAIGIAAASVLSVLIRRRWVGAVVVSLGLAATFLLLAADFYTMRALVAAITAAVAGMIIMAVPQRRLD